MIVAHAAASAVVAHVADEGPERNRRTGLQLPGEAMSKLVAPSIL